MYIQGDLQVIFDALYNLGVIDPVLEKDWVEEMNQLPEYYDEYSKAVSILNQCQGNFTLLLEELEKFDSKTLGFIAMEVAKEFADFHTRDELH